MKNLRLPMLALALWLTAVERGWSGQENGLLVYQEPPRTYVEVLRFTSITPGTAYATVLSPTGSVRQVWNTGMIAEVDYPNSDAAVDPHDANQHIKQLQSLMSKYPDWKYQLQGALVRWQNALSAAGTVKAAQPAAVTAQINTVPSLEVDGTEYQNVSLAGATESTASIMHSDGVTTFKLSDLTPTQIKALNRTSSSTQIDVDWLEQLKVSANPQSESAFPSDNTSAYQASNSGDQSSKAFNPLSQISDFFAKRGYAPSSLPAYDRQILLLHEEKPGLAFDVSVGGHDSTIKEVDIIFFVSLVPGAGNYHDESQLEKKAFRDSCELGFEEILNVTMSVVPSVDDVVNTWMSKDIMRIYSNVLTGFKDSITDDGFTYEFEWSPTGGICGLTITPSAK